MFSLLLVLWARWTGLLCYRDECCPFTWEISARSTWVHAVQETKPKWWNEKHYTLLLFLRLLYGFVDCFNLTTNSAVEKHTSPKNYAISATVVGIAKLFCQKMFHPGHPGWIVIWKNFHPQYRDLGRKVRDFGNRGSPASHLKQLNFFPKKRAARRDLGNRASSVDRAHMKRPSSSNTWESESAKAVKIDQCNQRSLKIIYLLIFQHCLRKYMPFRESTNKHFTHGKMIIA